MNDLNAWLKERRTIHDAATGGEWQRHDCKPCADRSSEDLSIWSADDPVAQWLDSDNPNQRADRDAIVDAHNTLPALLTAVENVLELHNRGDQIGGRYYCGECFDDEGFNGAIAVPWPCASVRAIEGAINE